MHLNTYVRMILDVLSNLRMPDRQCAKEMLGGPGSSERGVEESIWWKKTTKKFSNKTETFPERASDKKSFYSVADVRSEE